MDKFVAFEDRILARDERGSAITGEQVYREVACGGDIVFNSKVVNWLNEHFDDDDTSLVAGVSYLYRTAGSRLWLDMIDDADIERLRRDVLPPFVAGLCER